MNTINITIIVVNIIVVSLVSHKENSQMNKYIVSALANSIIEQICLKLQAAGIAKVSPATNVE